jgi:hypothetical protein
MMDRINGDDGRGMGGQDLSTTPTGMIFYRVVEDIFSDSEDIERAIDVVIQTIDPDDFADFGEAVEEAVDRLQERIDLEEAAQGPDRAHLDLLAEKFGDTGEALGEDWESYCRSISQPTVLVDGGEINLAEVEGRERFARCMRAGHPFSRCQVQIYEKLARQAGCGTGAPRVKAKTLKPRPRPHLAFAKVQIDPALAAAYSPALIRGLLTKHRQLFEAYPDWKPHRDGFVSALGRPETSDSYIHVLTVFLDGGTCITFAVAVPTGQLPPPDWAVMDRATIRFDPSVNPEVN